MGSNATASYKMDNEGGSRTRGRESNKAAGATARAPHPLPLAGAGGGALCDCKAQHVAGPIGGRGWHPFGILRMRARQRRQCCSRRAPALPYSRTMARGQLPQGCRIGLFPCGAARQVRRRVGVPGPHRAIRRSATSEASGLGRQAGRQGCHARSQGFCLLDALVAAQGDLCCVDGAAE